MLPASNARRSCTKHNNPGAEVDLLCMTWSVSCESRGFPLYLSLSVCVCVLALRCLVLVSGSGMEIGSEVCKAASAVIFVWLVTRSYAAAPPRRARILPALHLCMTFSLNKVPCFDAYSSLSAWCYNIYFSSRRARNPCVRALCIVLRQSDWISLRVLCMFLY